jgi:hypothetical protein
VLGVAAAFESAFANDSDLRRPTPDLARLASAPPLAQTSGFFAWD